MKTVSDHIKRYPNARPSTIAFIALRNERTEQLRAEIEASKRVNEYRNDIGYVGWFRRLFWRR